MAHTIRYDIVRTLRGWSIVCDGIAGGMPYLQGEVALRNPAWAVICSAKPARRSKSISATSRWNARTEMR
jgi:hypothetical protein